MSVRILVIDDEEAVCEILKFNLEKEGYEVDCAYSAEEALDMDLSGYSLFMVDIMMDRNSPPSCSVQPCPTRIRS